ncbi:MAG: GNAT family N-acetyltransferase [Saprospiraceae bacterium]
MFSTIIKTERLLLRPFERKDITPTLAMEQNPAINQYTNDGGIKTRAAVTELLETLIEVDYQEYGFGRFALEWKATGEFIGFCGLKFLKVSNEVDLGYRLKMKYWGMGLATEAAQASVKFGFDDLQLEKIVAFILPENKQSQRVLEKLNFVWEEAFVEDGALIHKFELRR